MIVDAHLDLAYNAVRGRNVLQSAWQQPPDEEGIPTVGLPDLHAGGVGLICGTIFCEPSLDGKPGYRTPDEARLAALQQWQWYQQQVDAGALRWIKSGGDVPATCSNGKAALPVVLLLEGADALRGPEDVGEWFARGLRIVGLAWKGTRYAGGTGAPGALTPAAAPLVKELDRLGIIHDVSHLAEESFWQLLEITAGPVIASHSNCRAIVPTDRQLSDTMIRAIGRRGGVIGINFFDRFLIPPNEYGTRRATLADVAAHVRRLADILGSAEQIGLGTDMDGGLGREQIPLEIATSAHLPRVGEALSSAGFSDEDIAGILGTNWVRYFQSALPS